MNAKFIHSSLALRMLKAFADDESVITKEYTINNNINNIIMDLYNTDVKIIGFSCYIWNVSMTIEIIDILKKVIPDIFIFVGGPESYELIKNKNIDLTVLGEGEQIFKQLLELFKNNSWDFSSIKGIAYKNNNEIIYTEKSELIELNDIPFVYNDDFLELDNKIIYYETTRGCPFSCQYCTSSMIDGIRFLSLDRVFGELQLFLDKNIPQVKFIDRTFNCNNNHALSIWEYIINHDNGITNFHFEISADLLNETQLTLLKTARMGLIQFEVGVQSTNLDTLKSIKRKTNLDKLFSNVKKIKSFNNIHQHLDLIAGLPMESYNSFKKSFNDVYSLNPEQLQLGFLKILKETGLKRDSLELGIVYSSIAPYEVLFTRDISFKELLKLKMIEEVLGVFYNSNKFRYTVNYIMGFYKTPFDFYENLSEYWQQNSFNMISHNKISLYLLFFEFIKEKATNNNKLNISFIKNLLKFDILINDNIKNIPDIFLEYSLMNELFKHKKNSVKDFFKDDKNENNIKKYFKNLEAYNGKQRFTMCATELFGFDLIAYKNKLEIIERESVILFNYHEKSFLDNKAVFYDITAELK